MDQFKTRILNTNLLAKYSDKPLLIFYVKVESLVVVQLLKTLDDYEFHFELTFPMGDSLVDSLDAAIQKVIGHKDFNRRAKVLMIMDDYYLTMNRFSIPESQLSQIDQMLEMEIDHCITNRVCTAFVGAQPSNVEGLVCFVSLKQKTA